MGKVRQMGIGAINIKMPPPHNANRYVELFEHAYRVEQKVALRGDWVGLIGSVRTELDSDGFPIVHGEFYKYVDLDETRAWFNVRKGKPADATELRTISIPSELKPHFQFLPFVFIARKHRLVLATKDGRDTLSSSQAVQILRKVFDANELVGLFGNVEVIVEPEREALATIFKMPRLRSLIIEVTPPNPDDFEEFERDLFDNMHTQRAGSYRIELKASGSDGLAPDAKTKQLAAVAQSNGNVVGVSGSRGKTKTVSTQDHPLADRAEYDPSKEVRSVVLLAKARELLGRILAVPPENSNA